MEGGILLMEFDSSNLKLDFNNINQELPPELFDIVVNTIEEESVVSVWGFDDYTHPSTHLLFHLILLRSISRSIPSTVLYFLLL